MEEEITNAESRNDEIPASIRNLTRRQLEEFCLQLLHHDHEQTHRANDLEEKIAKLVDSAK